MNRVDKMKRSIAVKELGAKLEKCNNPQHAACGTLRVLCGQCSARGDSRPGVIMKNLLSVAVILFAVTFSFAASNNQGPVTSPANGVPIFPQASTNDSPLKPKIVSIEGPCMQIIGRNCYNAYYRKATWRKEIDKTKKVKAKVYGDERAFFGFYSFDDPARKVTIVERFSCAKPNGVMKWDESKPNSSENDFPVYNSTKVKGLYASCVGYK